jgi:hypothetical protein
MWLAGIMVRDPSNCIARDNVVEKSEMNIENNDQKKERVK